MCRMQLHSPWFDFDTRRRTAVLSTCRLTILHVNFERNAVLNNITTVELSKRIQLNTWHLSPLIQTQTCPIHVPYTFLEVTAMFSFHLQTAMRTPA